MFDADDLEHMKKLWNNFSNSVTMCKCSSLMAEHEDYNLSRALQLVNVLQVDKTATKWTGKGGE